MSRMQESYSPSVRRRRISNQLRKFRNLKGYSMAKAGAELGWAQQKISKIENGDQKRVPVTEIDKLLDLYEVTDPEERESLHECSRLAKQKGWWSKYQNVFSGALPDFENEASRLRTYECQVLPGLLQTPAYAEGIIRSNQVRSDAETKKRVDARLKRQEILNRVDPPRYWVVVDEAALRRMVDSHETMIVQLRHLTHMAARHNIDIQVLPFAEGAHAATAGSFVIMDFPDPRDTSIAFVDAPTSSLFLEEYDEIVDFEAMFSGTQGSALSPEKSLKFISDIIESLEE